MEKVGKVGEKDLVDLQMEEMKLRVKLQKMREV